jgi:hypothetical protein
MKIKYSLNVVAVALLSVWYTGCDMGYPPIVVNQYKEPIEISLLFNGGDVRETGIRLPANTEFVQRRKGLAIYEIDVRESSGRMRRYSLADFEAARANRTVSFEVWFLTAQGLKLGDKTDFDNLLKSRHYR